MLMTNFSDGDQANGEEGLSQLEDHSAEEELEEKVQEEGITLTIPSTFHCWFFLSGYQD